MGGDSSPDHGDYDNQHKESFHSRQDIALREPGQVKTTGARSDHQVAIARPRYELVAPPVMTIRRRLTRVLHPADADSREPAQRHATGIQTDIAQYHEFTQAK